VDIKAALQKWYRTLSSRSLLNSHRHFESTTVRKRFVSYFAFVVLCLSLDPIHTVAQDANRDDWPQWGGPNRDHKSLTTGLKQSWPESGPPLVWKFSEAGFAYSACAVVDGKLYTLGSSDEKNFVLCLNASDGSQLWRTEIGPSAPKDSYRQDWGGGPRSTPTVVGERVLVLDDAGQLACLERDAGVVQWKVHLVDDFGGQLPKWGYSESPLVDGERVVVCPGNQQYLVALDLASGKPVLTSTGIDAPAHYVSVVQHAVDGVSMYITATVTGLVGFSATDGKVLWQNAASGNATATIPTPIVKGNLVYHTSAYSTGCVLVELSVVEGAVQAQEVYFNKNQQNHHGSVILVDEHVYGMRKSGGWLCQNLMSGEIAWNHRISGDSSASVTFADNRFYIYGEDSGTCYLVEPSPTEWIEHGKVSLPAQSQLNRGSGKIWTHPVVAEGKLFLRDLDLIYAFDISE